MRRNESETGPARRGLAQASQQELVMAGEATCPFPLLVEGAWGGSGLPKNLKKKLLCYFQSGKKSGGGECEIQERPGQVLVCFAQEEGKAGRGGGARLALLCM